MPTFTNDPVRVRKPQRTITTSTTLTEEYSGYDINIATDAIVATLPLITADNIGIEFTFRNTGAAGNNIITISPNAADGVFGNLVKSNGSNADATTADGLVAIASGTVNKDWVNTKATANRGDYCTLRAVALNQWWIVDGVGIWASEA